MSDKRVVPPVVPPVVRSVLRWLAIAIAVAAIVDPAFTSMRYGRLVVSVVAADARDPDVAALAARVTKALGSSATVIGAPFGAADATVIVGERLPDAAIASASPVFAVVGGFDEPRLAIESMVLPKRATIDASVPVEAGIRISGAAGRTIEVTLSAGGVTVDRAARRVRAADERVDLVLGAVAGDTGMLPLRLEARVAGGGAGVAADGAVDVRSHRHAVLFYDARPAFASTFVRRAVERDARVAVTARSMTSRAVSVDAGAPPARLDDAASLAPYDVVVVGAPGTLTGAAVAGLDAYMRTRGGSVVLLLDEGQPAGFERLTGARDWRLLAGQPVAVRHAGNAQALRATSFAWPVTLPFGASAIAVGDSARPVIWKSPVGAGQVLVSGALDAWRFRDAGSSAFERFWGDQIAEAAAHAPEAIVIEAPSAAAPSDRLTVGVDLRDVALRTRVGVPSARATVRARLTRLGGRDIRSPGGSDVRSLGGSDAGAALDELRLIPAGSVGHFEASFRAPAESGTYRIDVESGSDRASVPLLVRADAAVPVPAARATLDAWVAGHGGAVFAAGDVGRLPDAIRAASHATTSPEPWHPMRSAWWLAVFALALSAEWWLRRRQGLA